MINGVIQAVGYALVGIGCFYSFYVVMLGALIIGTGSAFGEISHYGYLKLFPTEYIGPFISGTGISGLAGSLLYLILHAYRVPDWLIFVFLVILALLYLTNFFTLNRVSETEYYFISSEKLKLTVSSSHLQDLESVNVSKD